MTTEQHSVESSEQITPSAWLLTESHEFLKNVLSCLPAIELYKCARVCKQWRNEVHRILKAREQLAWVSYNYNTAPEGGSDHSLGYFGENLEECIQSAWSVPRHVLMFTELVSRTDYTIGTQQKGHFGRIRNAAHVKRQSEIASTINLIQRQLPQHCTLLCLQTPGTVGTYPNMQLAGESEGDGGATAVLFPNMEGVDIRVLKAMQEALHDDNIEDVQDVIGLSQDPQQPVKCVLLFGYGHLSTAQVLAVELQRSFRKKQGCDPVIAGGMADDLLTKQQLTKMERQSNMIGMAFSGPNVQSASIIVGNDICSKEKVKQKLQQLKKVGLSEKKSIAFMFACVGRGVGFYEEEDVESTVFRELFPNTPLFGFFGNGEIGCDNLTCGKVEGDGEHNTSRLPDIAHGYTTVFCLLSFGKAT